MPGKSKCTGKLRRNIVSAFLSTLHGCITRSPGTLDRVRVRTVYTVPASTISALSTVRVQYPLLFDVGLYGYTGIRVTTVIQVQ